MSQHKDLSAVLLETHLLSGLSLLAPPLFLTTDSKLKDPLRQYQTYNRLSTTLAEISKDRLLQFPTMFARPSTMLLEASKGHQLLLPTMLSQINTTGLLQYPTMSSLHSTTLPTTDSRLRGQHLTMFNQPNTTLYQTFNDHPSTPSHSTLVPTSSLQDLVKLLPECLSTKVLPTSTTPQDLRVRDLRMETKDRESTIL